MTYVLFSPEVAGAVAADVESIGAALATSHAAAAGPTTAVAIAASDEVSTASAALFSQHAQDYQKLGAQAAAFHQQFVQALTGAGNAYAAAEAANASPLQTVEQDLLGVINA
ncbi:MAG: PE family protein, partial [Trebonia sp.]